MARPHERGTDRKRVERARPEAHREVDTELDDDLVCDDMTEVLTSFCALMGRARSRAKDGRGVEGGA